jgi:hypothetical protein
MANFSKSDCYEFGRPLEGHSIFAFGCRTHQYVGSELTASSSIGDPCIGPVNITVLFSRNTQPVEIF